ncbi:hypothetical protein ACFL5U_03030 [Candidatus Margulisiibacteriota bacterium]
MSTIVIKIFIFVLFSAVLIFPAQATEEAYPQLAISGYKSWRYNKFEAQPLVNYGAAVGNWQVQNSSGPWFEELRLSIQGDLNPDLRTTYNLSQIPGAAEIYTVGVDYQNYRLIMGDQRELFSDQEFLSHDFVSGLGFVGQWDKLKFTTVSGRYTRNVFANNTTSYEAWKLYRSPDYLGEKGGPSYYRDNPQLEYLGFKLGRVDIIGESVTVKIGQRQLIRNIDYVFDTATGLLLVLRSFKGSEPVIVDYQLNDGQTSQRSFSFARDAGRWAFSSPDFRIIDGSEIITVDGLRLDRDLDYQANYNLGLFILNRPAREDAVVRLDYEYAYGPSLFASETITGQTGITVSLAHDLLVSASESIAKNGTALTKGTDYTISYSAGSLTMASALTAVDTLEVSYSYSGSNKTFNVYNLEYSIAPGNKIGGSVAALISDPYTSTKNNLLDSKTYVWNALHQMVFNKNTLLRTEIAGNNTTIASSGGSSQEADTALKISAKTRLGDVYLAGTYRKTGLNFASVRKVKANSGWKQERRAVGIKYAHQRYGVFRGGIESAVELNQAAASLETTTQTTSLGYELKQLGPLALDLEIKSKRFSGELSGQQNSRQIYSGLDLNSVFSGLGRFSEETNLFCKYLRITNDGQTAASGSSRPLLGTTLSELGWRALFPGGFNSFISYKTEQEDNSVTRTSPFYRLAYKSKFFGLDNFEIYYDYSTTKQSSGTVNDNLSQNRVGYDFSWPIDNPVLSGFQMGAVVTTTAYTDLNNSTNDYTASEMSCQGRLSF